MSAARRAVIDVGTNSVKLLVAEVEGAVVRPLWEEGHQTRLGESFYSTHRLQSHAIQRTALAVAKYVTLAGSYEVQSIRIIATSAARDAVNQSELLDAIERHTGLASEVVTGEQEAELAYLGVTTDPAFAAQRLLIMDVGGGSTEFILGEGHHRISSTELPIGLGSLARRTSSERPACSQRASAMLRWPVRIHGPPSPTGLGAHSGRTS